MNSTSKLRGCVVFTGGGTGGHIFPGLAVADVLSSVCRQPLVWIGSVGGMDKMLIEKNPHIMCFIGVPSGKLRRYFSLRNFIDVFKIFGGFCSSLWHLSRLKPVLVFSKGGFVSVPVCYAAKLLGVPVFTHECDFSPGLATKLNMRVATKILVSFADTARFFSAAFKGRVIVTGNPVRPVFYEADPNAGREFLGLSKTLSAAEKPLLLVCGGSSGARQINDLVAENLDWLCGRFIVVHQTGGNFLSAASEMNDLQDNGKKNKFPENYHQYAFIYAEMPHVLAAADVVVSRAGSNSLWENAVTGKPMVLLPLAGTGTRGDQIENAAFFAEKNAALVLTNTPSVTENLQQTLQKMLDPNVREIYSRAAKMLAGGIKPAETIAHLIKEELEK